jgi:hypothetical protein
MAVAKVLCLILIMTLLHIQHPRKKEDKEGVSHDKEDKSGKCDMITHPAPKEERKNIRTKEQSTLLQDMDIVTSTCVTIG